MDNLFTQLLDPTDLMSLNQPLALLYLAVAVAMLLIGKAWFAFRVPYDLNHELGKTDNPAVAIAFGGFMFGLGLILLGVLKTHGLDQVGWDILDMAVTALAGIALLDLAQVVNHKVIFPKLAMNQLIASGNVAAGLAEGGTYLGTALIVMAAVSSSGLPLAGRVLQVVVFFVLGQLAFSVYARIYDKTTRFDLRKEIEHNNAAAGLSVGMSLIAMAVLLSYAIRSTGSLVAFGGWFILSTILLIVLRRLVDVLILSGHDLDQEISRDRNWGVALLEGSLTVVMAMILTAAF